MSAASTPNPHARKALFSSASDDWPTPLAFYQQLDAEFGFVLDACASTTNTKAPHFYALDHPDPARRDGLAGDWAADARRHGGGCWCNPPYGRQIGAWMAKAAATARQGVTVVCLVPARTDTKWFHDHVLAEDAEVRFVRGRLKFGNATTGAPFASLVIVYRGQASAGSADGAAAHADAGAGSAAAMASAEPARPHDWQPARPLTTRMSGGYTARSRQHQARMVAVRTASAEPCPDAAVATRAVGRREKPTSDRPTPSGTLPLATALISPLRTVRPVTTSTTGPTPAARTPKTCPDSAATLPAPTAPAPTDPAASRQPEAVIPQRVLALGEAYTAERARAGSEVAPSIINRHLYWLQTGRLPDKPGKAFDYSDVDNPEPGWVPIDPRTTTLDRWERYRVALMDADIKRNTRAKETTIIRGFYDWLRGPADNPLPRKRKPNGEKNDEATVCIPGSTRAEVLSYYSTAETRSLLAAADAAVEAAATTGGGGAARWLRAEVERTCTWMMWGTGVLSGQLTRLDLDDLDLDRREVTWRNPDGTIQRVQPLTALLVERLRDYLTRVRPQLPGASTSRRVFLNALGQGDKTLTPRFLQDLTRKLARAAGLPEDPTWQRHNPRTWAHTYAMRVLEAPRGTLVAVMALHGQKNYGPVKLTYGSRLPAQHPVRDSDVFPDLPGPAAADPAVWDLAAPDAVARCA